MKFAHKIVLMPAVAGLAFAALFLTNEVSRARVARLMTEIRTEYIPAVEVSRDVETGLAGLQRALQDAAAAADVGQLQRADRAKDDLVARLRAGAVVPYLHDESRATQAQLEEYYTLARALTGRLIREERGEFVDRGLHDLQDRYLALKSGIEVSTERHRAKMTVAFEEAAANQRRSATAMSAVIALALLVLGLVSTRIIRSTTVGLRQAVAVADRLSHGDLTVVPASGSGDEVGQLLTSMRRMMGYLRETAALADRIGGTEREPQAQESSLGNAFGRIAEAESRHRNLLESVPAILWRADTTQRFLFVSPGAEKMLGYSTQCWTADPSFWQGRVHPHDRERATAASLRAAATGQEQEVEYRMLTNGGGTVWLHGSIQRVVGSGGAPELVGVLLDVTEQKRGEAELKQSQKQLAEAQALAHVGSWEWDVVSNKLTWSEELCRIFARTTPPARVEGLVSLIHPEDRDSVRVRIDSALRAIESFTQDLRILRPDGSVRVIRLAGNVIVDDTDRPTRMVGAAQDITEAEAAVLALKESEERYRALFENNPQAMWVYDPKSLRFLAVNDAALQQYGYERGELVETNVLALHLPEDAEDVRAGATAAGNGPAQTKVWRHRRKDGSLMDIEVCSRGIAYGEWPARLVLANDITERRRLEQQLRQAQKMEAIGQLAGGVAHDFNNILGVIMGYGQLLQQRLPAGDPLQKNVGEILKGSDRAAALTRQLLAFSRKQILQPKVLDLNAVVSDVDKMLRRLIGEDVRLVASPQIHLGQVKADPGQMEQILMNLAVNARDAMPSGGTLIIETRNVDLDAAYAQAHAGAQAGPHVMLAVSDTGHGMGADTLSHIFEPFFTTKGQGKGTGLGLATVYGIVKQSGGYIAVYSEIDRGTTFKVYLPRVEEAVEVRATAPVLPPPRGAETVLLVEDEEALRSMIREILEEAGYGVLEGPTPLEAFDLAESHTGPIHLLITDVVMPGESGRQLAQRLEAVRPDLRTLYMSGYTDDAIGHHGLLEPGTHFLQKPFTADVLLRKIRDVLGGQARETA